MLLNGGVYAQQRTFARATIAQFTTPQSSFRGDGTRRLGRADRRRVARDNIFRSTDVAYRIYRDSIWIELRTGQLFIVMRTKPRASDAGDYEDSAGRPALMMR